MIFTGSLTIFVGFYASYYALCKWYIHRGKAPLETHFEEEELLRVSIIIPVYNESKVLANEVESLAKLDYPKNKL